MYSRLIIAGRGIRLADAMKELKTCSKNFRIMTTILGKDLINSKISEGTIGIKGTVDDLINMAEEIYFVGCSMPIAQLGYDLTKWKNKKVYSVNIDPPNGLIKCEWINKDAKVWLREQRGFKV